MGTFHNFATWERWLRGDSAARVLMRKNMNDILCLCAISFIFVVYDKIYGTIK